MAAITVATIYTLCLGHYPDMPQTSFISFINEIEQYIQTQVKTVAMQSTTINLTNATQSYALSDPDMMIWEVEYTTAAGSATRLEQTTSRYLDSESPGWRNQAVGTPTYWYHDGQNIGFFPNPNTTTSGGYPVATVYYTPLPSALSSGSSLPTRIRSFKPYVYGCCKLFAAMQHPDGIQVFSALFEASMNELRAYISGTSDQTAI